MNDIKRIWVNIPKETWIKLKQATIEQERPMVAIVLECIEKYLKQKK